MKIKDSTDIQAIGNLLSNFESDLLYIRNFQLFKKGKISPKEYCEKKQGTFYSFLIEYRVTRNFEKNSVDTLLDITKGWIKTPSADKVDEFAIHLNDEGLTHGKIMTVMASKILFLNNPWKILPMDAFSKVAIGQNNNSYGDYQSKIKEVKKLINPIIKGSFNNVKPYLKLVESLYDTDLKDIQTIRENRLIDKILWTLGKSGKTFFDDYM